MWLPTLQTKHPMDSLSSNGFVKMCLKGLRLDDFIWVFLKAPIVVGRDTLGLWEDCVWFLPGNRIIRAHWFQEPNQSRSVITHFESFFLMTHKKSALVLGFFARPARESNCQLSSIHFLHYIFLRHSQTCCFMCSVGPAGEEGPSKLPQSQARGALNGAYKCFITRHSTSFENSQEAYLLLLRRAKRVRP